MAPPGPFPRAGAGRPPSRLALSRPPTPLTLPSGSSGGRAGGRGAALGCVSRRIAQKYFCQEGERQPTPADGGGGKRKRI